MQVYTCKYIDMSHPVILFVHTYEGIVKDAVIGPDLLDTLPEHAVCTRARLSLRTYQFFHDRYKTTVVLETNALARLEARRAAKKGLLPGKQPEVHPVC